MTKEQIVAEIAKYDLSLISTQEGAGCEITRYEIVGPKRKELVIEVFTLSAKALEEDPCFNITYSGLSFPKEKEFNLDRVEDYLTYFTSDRPASELGFYFSNTISDARYCEK
jgi:hypothetical protein